MPEVKFESSVNEVIEETAGRGMLTLLPVGTPLDVQLDTLGEGKFININAESGCDEKEDYVPEVTAGKYFTVKKLLEIFHDIEHAKEKTLEVDPDLERSLTILPRRRKDA